MSNIADLNYPPGIKPSENSTKKGKVTYQLSNQPLLVSNSTEHKYSLTEAKLRIFSCCRDLGITETHAVKYPDLQRAYKLKFDIELDRSELFNLFANRNATNALKDGLRSFIHVIEASKSDDNVIRLNLKEAADQYIKELQDRYDGPPFRTLTNDEVDSIFNPQKRDNYRNGYNNQQRFQSRGGGGARFISRNYRYDGGQGPPHQYYQRQQYCNQFGAPQGSFAPEYGNYNYRNQYPSSNFQRPFNPHYNYNCNNNRFTQNPMAAFINEKKQQKQNELQQIRDQRKLLQENYSKMKKEHEDERERIIKEINDESNAELKNLLTCYYDKLGEIAEHAVAENKIIVEEYLKLKN